MRSTFRSDSSIAQSEAVLEQQYWAQDICKADMLQVLAPHTAPIWVSAVRLLPAGAVLIAWAARQGRPQPQGRMAWVAISLFALADGACFQVMIPSLCSWVHPPSLAHPCA